MNVVVSWQSIVCLGVLGLVVGFVNFPATARPTGEEVVPGPSYSAVPTDDAVADRCRRMLESSVFDFYFPGCIDQHQGGYLESLDDNGNFIGTDKFLTLQARQLWFFSACAVQGIHRDESLAAAKTGYAFLQNHFRDPDNGGYFVSTTREGAPVDRRKHVYPLSFVIYGFVEYHRATGLQAPLDEALKLFEELDLHCHDAINGGYGEMFSVDWKLITDTSQWGVVGAVGTKTYNSHLHLLESFTQLYHETKDTRVKERLSELILINTVTVRHPLHRCNIDAWTPKWQMIETEANLRASFGHDVECAWLVLEANAAVGRQAGVLRNWAIEICDHAIENGWDQKHHGFYYSAPLGMPSDDRKKEWWPQAEAMVAMLTMFRLTGNEKYRKLFQQTLDFVEQHQVSEAGGWWAVVAEDGSVGPVKMRASKWKGAYHDGRSLLMCEKLLRQQLGEAAETPE